ncbi:MAG: alpha/beta fold hydrolase [Rubrimonas sp.]|uniref:alpha/beta fold hydrolase n=1 Tax=Rubrimonas sp. TaxID=2036015 RepID=UPI002FDED123
MRSLYLSAHDACLRWHETAGDGPPVLALPGLSFPAVGVFLPVATRGALRDRRWILADYLGSGASDWRARPLAGLDDDADCMAALLDHLDCGPCAVVGHSMGGSVGIALALRRPDLVAHLVVAEANLLPGGGAATRRIAAHDADRFAAEEFPAMLARRRAAARAGDAAAAFVAGAWAHADPRALHANSRALVDLPAGFLDAFLALAIPRAFFYGARTHPDATGAPAPDAPDPEPLRAAGVRVAVIPDCGHDMTTENPAGFAAALVAELDRGAG